jgi:predicted site-specific integrase-resolvase
MKSEKHLTREPQTQLATPFQEWCRSVGISPASGYKYAKQGKINLTRIGGRTLITSEESARVLADGIAK